MRFLAAILLALFLAPAVVGGGGFALAAPSFPALTGRVVDDAHILSDTTQADLTQKLAALEQQTSRQLVVVTVPSLGGYEISDYGYQLGRAWGIGQKSLNNGVLLIVAPTEHRVRIEVGYGLEPILTDAFSSVVINTQMTPKFKAGDFNGGVEAGADALIQQLSLDTSTAEKRAAAAEQQAGRTGNDSPPLSVILIFLVIAFVFFHFFGGWWMLPLLFSGGGGGRGGWGGGGGGFSGGGGSFGGGGASGSW
jgi:uncharacterized protein